MDTNTAFENSLQENLRPPDRGRRRRAITDPCSLASADSGYGTNRPLTPEFTLNPNPREINKRLRPETKRTEKSHPKFQCTLCPKAFRRAYNLRSHLRTHSGDHTFVCQTCGRGFTRENDKRRHVKLHGDQNFVCGGNIIDGNRWGCGESFARFDELARHFVSENGRLCITPLWEEETIMNRVDINHPVPGRSPKLPIDHSGTSTIWPIALLQQYPDLESLSLMAPRNESNEAKLIGRSNSDASDAKYYDDEARLMDWSASTLYRSLDGTAPNKGSLQLTGISICSTKNDPLGHSLLNTPLSTNHQGPQDSKPVSDLDQPIAYTNSRFEGSFGVKDLSLTFRCGNFPAETALSYPSETRRPSLVKSQEALENTTCLADGLPTNTDLWEDAEKELEQQRNHHSPKEVPFEDSESIIYDTATPGSAYSVTTSSSASDRLCSDAEYVYGTSIWSGAPDRDEECSLISPILDTTRRQLVERVMVEFHSMLDQSSGFRSRGNSTGSHNSGTSNAGDLWTGGSGPSGRKRKLEGDDDQEPPNEGRGEGSDKRPRTSAEGHTNNHKFACPYFKRNSRRHTKYRSCVGPGWDTVHRIKEHLYRRHALPIQCARCCHPFKSETELKQHLRSLQTCEIQEEDPPEGFDKEQEKLLKSRKKTSPDQGEEGKWKEVYRILFPDEDESSMPSPYYDNEEALSSARWERHRSAEFANYEEFLSRELPRRVRRELEDAASQVSGTLEDRLKSQLVEIVRNCQAQLFKSYQQTQHVARTTGEGIGAPTPTPNPQRASANTTQLPYMVEDDLAAFCAPPTLPDDELLPHFGSTPGNPRIYQPIYRSSDMDSGYASQNLASSQNQGSSPLRDSSDSKEQTGFDTHIPQNFGEPNSYGRSGIFGEFLIDVPWDHLEAESSPDHFLNEFPSYNAFNQVEATITSLDGEENITSPDISRFRFGSTN